MKEILIKSTGKNQTEEIVRVLAENKKDVCLVFEPQEYHFYRKGCHEGMFYPSNNKYGYKYVVFFLSECENVKIIGNGAQFIFHDRVFPFIIQGGKNITLQGFTIDFAFPRNYCAEVAESNDEYLEFFIDKKKYPYELKGGHMICRTESEDISSADYKFFLSDYDKDVEEGTTITSLMVGDCSVDPSAFPKDGLRTDASEAGENIVRFTYRPGSNRLQYCRGHHIVFHFDEDRQYDTIFVDGSEDVALLDIEILRGAGMGVIAQFTHNMLLERINIHRKEGRGDLVTTTADALMFVNCSGKVTLKNSYIANSLDDGFNLHGLYTHIEKVEKDGLYVYLGHREQVGVNPFRKGDTIQVIDGSTLQIKEKLHVAEAELQPDLKHIRVRTVESPCHVSADDFAENVDRMPEVEFLDNQFEMCPSIIIATPKKVLFARNRIHSRCAGLRIIDSPKLWYEAGRSENVEVRDNEFINCGEGYDEYILTVTVNANFSCGKDEYIHKNICFAGNRISARNGKILYLQYAQGVVVEGNSFERTGLFKEETAFAPLKIEHCKDIVLRDNQLKF